MTAFRRPHWNFALDRAVEWCRELGKPLVVLEALRCDYPWASDRHHAFVLEGMRDNAAAFERAGIGYFPYVEPRRGAGRGLLAALASDAAVVVSDDYPAFVIPRQAAAAAANLDVRLELVDSNGLLPMRAAPRAFPTAYAFRRFLQKTLAEHVQSRPLAHPLRRVRARGASVRPATERKWRSGVPDRLARLPIDHSVKPVGRRGGFRAARSTLDRFVRTGLARYADERNDAAHDVTSGLSPYLHFGHIAVHEVFARVMRDAGWLGRVPGRGSGAREGWWGVQREVEAFLDELVTWRELGFNMCANRPDYDQYESLPAWAQATLAAHARDERPHLYTLSQLESGATHDRLWNAAQCQLVREGRIHAYLRMLWGKKILHWTRSPGEALAAMVELNNKYALDGRDPNSYSGIFWVLGRYDRPWPERPVFGTVRYMSSESTARKMRVDGYVRRYLQDAG